MPAGKVVNVEQVVAIIGASCSGATNGMVQSVTIPAGVVALSDSATAPSITDLEDNDTVFRVAPSDAYQGLAIAQLAIDQGYKKLAMTYSNDDYNAGIATVFEQAFQDLGGEITANQAHEPNKASYRSEISTLSWQRRRRPRDLRLLRRQRHHHHPKFSRKRPVRQVHGRRRHVRRLRDRADRRRYAPR